MTKPILVPLPGNEAMAGRIAAHFAADIGELTVRRFADGETYVRFESALRDRSVALLCTLDRPDDKIVPLLFAAAAARELGARAVGLVCPYLAYMRQDRRFQPGEAVTSAHFAKWLSGAADWLITVDPHLHRLKSLGEIYSIPTAALHAAPLIARFIKDAVERPVIVGPDRESEQWVASVARDAAAPYVVLEKLRRGEHAVEISMPDMEEWRDHTPVLVDDIIATGGTMIEAVTRLKRAGAKPPICIAVHGVFAGSAYEALMAAGAGRVVTTNTIAHPSNGIDVSMLIADGLRSMLAGASRSSSRS